MVGVVGSSPIAPTKYGRKIKHLAETLGAFFCWYHTSTKNHPWIYGFETRRCKLAPRSSFRNPVLMLLAPMFGRVPATRGQAVALCAELLTQAHRLALPGGHPHSRSPPPPNTLRELDVAGRRPGGPAGSLAVTSRRNPATRSRHIPARRRDAQERLEGLF